MDNIREDILDIVACPECRSDLLLFEDKLRCSSCKEEYFIEDGIPILLPKSVKMEVGRSNDRWDEIYEDLDVCKEDPLLTDCHKSTLAHIDAVWEYSDDHLFFEAGCGTADVARNYARKGRRVVGLDFSMNALRTGKRYFDKEGLDCLLICGDLSKLPFKAGIFNFIYAGGSIEHFEDTYSSVAGFERILKPGGFLTALVPVVSLSMITYGMLYGNLPVLPGLFQIAKFVHHDLFKGRFAKYGYEKSFTIRGIRNIFESAGLSRIDTGYFNTEYDIKLFKNKLLKAGCRKLLRYRPFWPMIYINGVK